jgi:hypothetical protein
MLLPHIAGEICAAAAQMSRITPRVAGWKAKQPKLLAPNAGPEWRAAAPSLWPRPDPSNAALICATSGHKKFQARIASGCISKIHSYSCVMKLVLFALLLVVVGYGALASPHPST